VCPARFDLGHHRNITLLSVTEGDDKPAKYPVMFRAADLMLITKTDLLAVLDDFECSNARRYLRELANPATVLELSARKQLGVDLWIDWLKQQLQDYRQACDRGIAVKPNVQPEGVRLHQASVRPGKHQSVLR
jgi:hydrogenase nickel incorporation protein HypB